MKEKILDEVLRRVMFLSSSFGLQRGPRFAHPGKLKFVLGMLDEILMPLDLVFFTSENFFY